MATRYKFNTTVMLLAAALGAYGLVMGGLIGFGGVKTEEVVDRTGDFTARAGMLATSSEQVITMLFTILVGVLVGVAFIFRDREFRFKVARLTQIAFVAILGMATLVSVFYAYSARMEILEIARKASVPYEKIDIYIARQALSLVVVVGAALALFVVYLTEKHRVTATRRATAGGGGPVQPKAPREK